jgi:hypothetical protein
MLLSDLTLQILCEAWLLSVPLCLHVGFSAQSPAKLPSQYAHYLMLTAASLYSSFNLLHNANTIFQ